MIPDHGRGRKSLHWYRKRSPFLVKLTWEKTNQKGAGRYLPTGNHSGCDAVHIPKRRHVLWQAFQQLGLHAAQSGNRAAGLPKEAMVCAFIVMKRVSWIDAMSSGAIFWYAEVLLAANAGTAKLNAIDKVKIMLKIWVVNFFIRICLPILFSVLLWSRPWS